MYLCPQKETFRIITKLSFMERQRENFLMTRNVNHSVTVGLAALALCSVSANLMAAVNNPEIAREVILPQNESLIGYVYDQDKNPLPGVTVKVEGTQIVTVTDDEGRYSFSQPIKRGANVKFSMLGFKTKRVVYKGQSAISPMLEPSATSVGEVVVVARSNINAIDLRAKSGVVENVDMKRVEAKPMIDMALALQGAVPGLVVTNTGDLGSAPKIRLRGNSSLRQGNATNEPLYVMDGQIISAETFYNLNPSDIKGMKVLKDATACALYGVKAANGVIEITSQRGHSGAPLINYSTNMGVTTRGRRGLKMMSSAEKLELERLIGNVETPGYRYSEDYYRKYFADNPNLASMIADGQNKLDSLRNINTDWFNELLRNSFYQRHNLSLRGGNERTTYFLSANYSYQGGRIEGNDKQRMGIRLNVDQKLGKIGYAMLGVTGSYSKTNTPNGTSSDPSSLIYELNPYEQKTGKLWSYPGQTYKDLMNQYSAESTDKEFGVNGNITLNLLPGLDVAAVAGIDFVLDESHQFTPSTAYSETHSGVPEVARGIYSKSKNTTTNISANVRATYTRTFNEIHDLTFSANMDYYDTNIDNLSTTGYGVGTLNSAAAINQSLTGSRRVKMSAPRDKNRQLGIGGVLGYSLLSTYDLYATYKADASSVLPSDKRWNKAWAVGLGWTPSNYAFLKDNKVISRLNFKGSYGITANLNGVSASTTTGTFSYSTNTYEDQRVLELISLYNKDLKPEQNKSVDLGMSMDLFNRITLDVNYYNRRTEQALLDVPIPTSVGYSTLKRNIGVLENRGIELGLSAKIIDTYDCRLSIGANLAYNDNKVLDLYYADKIYTTEDALVPDYEVGKSYDMLYGPTSLGINPLTGYPVFLLPDGTEKQATEALTKDDVVALGHLTPPYSGTFNLSFSYKSFDFDMDFYYVHGGIQRFNYSYVRDKDNVNKNAVAGQTDKMWFKQGDENKTYWTPFYTSSTAEDNIALYPNSRTVGKSDYLRLSMVSMRYRLPAATLHKILPFMQYATVGFQASNLFTWTSYKESDPESGTLAGTTQPIYTFNLNLTF